MKIKLPAQASDRLNIPQTILIESKTLRDALRHLWAEYPNVRKKLLDTETRPTRFVSLHLNGTHLSELPSGMDTLTDNSSELRFTMPIAGG